MAGKRVSEQVHAVVEIREQRPVQVIFGKVGRYPVGVEGVEVRRRVSCDHNRHRAEQRGMVPILGGHGGAGGIGHRAGAEQNQAVDAVGLELSCNRWKRCMCIRARSGIAGIADPPIVAPAG